MSTRHRHRFQRLSDEAIFCECGEIRQAPKPPYVPVPNITIDPVRLPDPWIGPNTWPRWVPNTTTVIYDNVSTRHLETFSTTRPDVFVPRTIS